MTSYAIGDLHGCLQPLKQLLVEIGFNSNQDTLLFCGDLVNRGPESLAALRFVKKLAEQGVAKTVLGNHDFHLFTVMAGYGNIKRNDTLGEILAAKDRHLLRQWLMHQPLTTLYERTSHTNVPESVWLSHAGLYPAWSVEHATELAKEVEEALQHHQHNTLLAGLYGNTPTQWHETLSGIERLRFIVNALTRMRFVTPLGDLLLKIKTAPTDTPPDIDAKPWFEWLTTEQTQSKRILFGHWSMLNGHCAHPNIEALDTGCVWGGALTALNLQTWERHAVHNHY